MCKKRNTVTIQIQGKKVRINACLRAVLLRLNEIGHKTLASCCGHGIYPPTIIIADWEIINSKKVGAEPYEYFTQITVPRMRRFYKKDQKGFYYIPEVQDFQEKYLRKKE